MSADYVYKIIYDLTQDINASNEVINQVYSDIYYGISGLAAPEYFYAWAGQIATTDTVRYLIQQGRMELPKEEKTPYVKSAGVGSSFDTGYDGTTVGYSEAADYNGTFGDGSVRSYVNTDGVAANGHMSRTNDGSTVVREHIAATGNGSKTAAGSLGENSNVGANIQAEYETVPEYYSEDREKFIPDSILVDTEKQRLIREYIESLSPFSKAVLQYYYYEEVSVKYIAETIGCSSNVIKKSLHEVKSRLKDMLGVESVSENGLGIMNGGSAEQLYDMTAIPLLWLIFKSTLANVPVSTLMAGSAAIVGVVGTAAGVGAAGAGATGVGAAGVGATGVGTAGATGVGAAAGAVVESASVGSTLGSGVSFGYGSSTAVQSTAGMGISGGMTGEKAGVKGISALKKASAGVKVAAAVAATAVVGGGVAAGVHYKSVKDHTIYLNQYITIEVDGYDSVGTAEYYFDSQAFYADYGDKVGNEKVYALTSEPIKLLRDGIKCGLDQTKGLSNGDVITLEWRCDDEWVMNGFGYKLDYSDIEYTVEGLEEVGVFEPFEYVDITFEGMSPNGKVVFTKDESVEEMKDISFSVENNNNLSNGDEITVTASISGSDDNFSNYYGVVLGKTEQTYVVQGLDEYVTDANDISQSCIKEMADAGEAAFKEEELDDRDDDNGRKMLSITYAGYAFLALKPESEKSTSNYIYIVYKVKAYEPDTDETFEYYYYVRFEDILLHSNGECEVDLDDYEVPFCSELLPSSSEGFRVGSYLYAGYQDLNEMFDSIKDGKADDYNFTTNLE